MMIEMSFPGLGALQLSSRQIRRVMEGVLLAGAVTAVLLVGLSRRCCGKRVPGVAAVDCCGEGRACDRAGGPGCVPAGPAAR